MVLKAGCPGVYQIMVAGRQFHVAIGFVKEQGPLRRQTRAIGRDGPTRAPGELPN